MSLVFGLLFAVAMWGLFSVFLDTKSRLIRIGTQIRTILGKLAYDSELIEQRIKEDLSKKEFADVEFVIQLSQFSQRMAGK